MISIFTTPVKKSHAPDHHLTPVSSIIRGDQIASWTKANLNPTRHFERDTCIFVKARARDIPKLERIPYVDIIDGYGLCDMLREHSELPVIVCSKLDYQVLSGVINNRLIFIPQHSCNFDHLTRKRDGITVVGIIGTHYAWQFVPEGLKSALEERRMKLWEYSEFTCREDVVDFYQHIDLQIVWRPYKKKLSNPLKIVNALSFGVPTVACYEPAFDEVRDYYISVETFEELLGKIDLLRSNTTLYDDMTQSGIEASERYDIRRVAEMYKGLDR